jgi:hypothetical protein
MFSNFFTVEFKRNSRADRTALLSAVNFSSTEALKCGFFGQSVSDTFNECFRSVACHSSQQAVRMSCFSDGALPSRSPSNATLLPPNHKLLQCGSSA